MIGGAFPSHCAFAVSVLFRSNSLPGNEMKVVIVLFFCMSIIYRLYDKFFS